MAPPAPDSTLSTSSQPPSRPTSRRTSQMTGTPLLPHVTSSGFHHEHVDPNTPMRHPRPLTAAELHLEFEKEQEAVVNRLARELSALRAHSASVASNASSSNASALEHSSQATPDAAHLPPHRHRSSSSLSTRSVTAHGSVPHGVSTSQASVERARDAVGIRSQEMPLIGVGRPLGSRSRTPSASASPRLAGPTVDPLLMATASRHEETDRARAGLEMALKENEILASRVKELERMLAERDTTVRW